MSKSLYLSLRRVTALAKSVARQYEKTDPIKASRIKNDVARVRVFTEAEGEFIHLWTEDNG